jgi:hypothetical protein
MSSEVTRVPNGNVYSARAEGEAIGTKLNVRSASVCGPTGVHWRSFFESAKKRLLWLGPDPPMGWWLVVDTGHK